MLMRGLSEFDQGAAEGIEFERKLQLNRATHQARTSLRYEPGVWHD